MENAVQTAVMWDSLFCVIRTPPYYKYPINITYFFNELKGPLPLLMKQMPNIRKLKGQRGIGTEISEMDLTK